MSEFEKELGWDDVIEKAILRFFPQVTTTLR